MPTGPAGRRQTLPSDDGTLPWDAAWETTGRPESWRTWRQRLPSLVADVLDEWQVLPDGYRRVGECALVLGVQTGDGQLAALKFGWPHAESAHEHIALRWWSGDGAVRLVRADPTRGVLLMERAGPHDLNSVDEHTACRVVAALYRRLHRLAGPPFPRLSERCGQWADELRALPSDAPAPRRLLQQAAALATDLATDRETDGRLIHGDLHFANVLSSDRTPWLAIDPKPMSGDPCFEVAPLLWNRWDEMVDSGNVRTAIRRRADAVVQTADLDPDRVRDSVIVRAMVNVLWALQESSEMSSADRDWITRSLTIAKAVQG